MDKEMKKSCDQVLKFDPDVFAKRHVELLDEVHNLRLRRNECVTKYEKLRGRMQGIVLFAQLIDNNLGNLYPAEIEIALRDLKKLILSEGK